MRFVLALSAALTVHAAIASNSAYGDSLAMGSGSLRPFVTLDDDSTPVEIGIEFDDAALTGLPFDILSDGTWNIANGDGSIAWYCCGVEHVLTAPEGTPFDHVVVNWNPVGHPPPGVYSVPHFDVHFYLISNAERTAISAPQQATDMCNDATQYPAPFVLPFPLTCETAARALAPLSPDQTPPDYFSPGAVEPGMGNHMLDVTARELNGEPFDHTFIFGTWDGKIHFFEPMITLEFLKGLTGEACFDLKMPSGFAEAGYYPTQYCMAHQEDAGVYRVTLAGFRRYEGE